MLAHELLACCGHGDGHLGLRQLIQAPCSPLVIGGLHPQGIGALRQRKRHPQSLPVWRERQGLRQLARRRVDERVDRQEAQAHVAYQAGN